LLGRCGDDRDRSILHWQRLGVEDRARLALDMLLKVEEGVLRLEESDAWRAVVHRNDPTRRETIDDRRGLPRSDRGTTAHRDEQKIYSADCLGLLVAEPLLAESPK
jgi:hypothetical protein